MEKGSRSQGSEAFFNYLLNYDVAGTQLLNTKAPISNCILVISIDKFYWYCDDEPAVSFLIPFVQHLPNQVVICGQTLNVLTSQNYYQVNGGSIKQMTNEEYDSLFSQKDITESVIKYDKTSKFPPHIVFLKQIFRDADEENNNIAIPAELSEVPMLQQILQEQQLKLVSIQQSIHFLLYGHVDAGSIKALQNVASRLHRIYTEVISVPNARKQEVLQRAIGQTSKQPVKILDIDKIHIVDISIQDPKLPIIYRMPYIILDHEIGSDQQEAVRLLGFVDHAITKSGLAQLAELLDNEENVSQTFKQYMGKILLKDQPEAYRTPLQQAIETMQLSISRKQLFDSKDKLFGRYLMNIQLKITLTHGGNDYIVIYGRSYVKCGKKIININDQLGRFVMEKPEFSLFDDRKRVCYSFKEKQLSAEEQNELKMQSQNAVHCDINVCLLLHNKRTQLGELKRLQPTIKGSLSIEPFRVNMRLDDVNQQAEIYLQNQQLSKRYVQQIAVFSKIKEEDKFRPAFRNRNFYICSFDLQHFVDLFGDYLFGYLSYEYRYLLEEDPDRVIEGFAIEFVVPKGPMMHRLQSEMQSGDYQVYEDLHKYTFLDPEEGTNSDFEESKALFDFETFRNDFLKVDAEYIFKGVNNAGYIDALLKGSERPGKPIERKENTLYAKSRLVLIQTPNGIAEHQLILSCIVKYFKQQLYGSKSHLLVVQTDEQMIQIQKFNIPKLEETTNKQQTHTYVVCCNECYSIAIASKFLECGSELTCIACRPYANTINLLEKDERQMFQPVSFSGLLSQLSITNDQKQKIYSNPQYNARIYSLEEQQEQIEREQENTIINYMKNQKQAKRVKTCVNQYYIDNQEMFERLGEVKFNSNLKYFGFFYDQRSTQFGNVIQQTIIRHEDELSLGKQVNLKLLSETFKRPEIRLMFKQISLENAIFQFRFDRFIIEVYKQKFCIDLDPLFLLNEQIMQYMTTTICCLDKRYLQYLTKLAQTAMNSLFLVVQSLGDETPQSSQKATRNEINWLEIKNYYKDLPPPPGYFYYYGMYMDWYGNIEHDRPDKKQLIERYYKEVLKKEVPGSLQNSNVSEIIQSERDE